MKILIICNASTGLLTFRGMLIKELIAKKNNISVIVPKTSEEQEINAEIGLERLGCKLIRIPIERRGINPIWDSILLYRYFVTIKRVKPGLVMTYTIKPNIYGGFVSRILSVPYAVNVTGLGSTFQKSGTLKKLVTIMYRIALKKAKIVFFENVENRDVLVDTRIVPEEKTHVLAGAGVDLEHFRYLDYPKEETMTKFLFIGRVMKEKGVDELFNAMQALNSKGYICSLDVLGRFEENYLIKIQQYEKEGWLHYRGYQKDIKPFVERCHCVVLPSWHEGMANSNLECAAMGRPVITSDIHGCLEAVEEGVSGFLCEKQNADNLSDIMKKFIELPYEKKIKMGIAGRERMKLIFDKRKVVNETIENL